MPYDELVKLLRICGDSNNSCGNCPLLEDGSCPHGEWEFAAEKYMLEAADAIEGLQKVSNKLLAKYQEEATSMIWEYSGNIEKSLDYLHEEIRTLQAQIDGKRSRRRRMSRDGKRDMV